ncbi:MAG: 5'-nucleotidase, lipoprotein e(P4) family [Porphyromonadaceae bacterium]|nr:MAG: 5'-nucleotidase, lipoprotein e(P4) family [Porphyromonadaceae bacterium]
MRYFISFHVLLLMLLSTQPSIGQTIPDQSVTAVLWFQRSAEYRALCYQAYNLAELRAKEYLVNPDMEKQAAVIFDIDETLLDNSPSEALNIIDDKTYSQERWKVWSDLASAAAIPGSLDFCHFLARNDIQVIYVSNRQNTESMATLQNLQKWNFPYADRNHLYLKSDASSKEFRRNVIEKQYNVILLVGDNLSDFDLVFEDRSVNFGYKTVDSLRFELGKKFIILPNPMYGDWTKPLTGERKSWLNTKGK